MNSFEGPGTIRLARYVSRRISVCFQELPAAPDGITLAGGSGKRKLGTGMKFIDWLFGGQIEAPLLSCLGAMGKLAV